MTDLALTINNVDFKGYVKKGEYYTSSTPVAGSKYTDLNKVDHTTVVRHRGAVRVIFNPMSPTQIASLYSALASCPCTVTYFSFQENKNVTQTMMPALEELQDAKQRTSGHWIRSFGLTLTEE
jgi:hypothetical protein